MNELTQLLAVDRLLMQAEVPHRRDLPICIGVIADLRGKPAEPPPPIAERRFVPVRLDHLDDFMACVGPRVAFEVPNAFHRDRPLRVDLTFRCMPDLEPASLAAQIDRHLQQQRDNEVEPHGGREAPLQEVVNAQLDTVLHHPDFQRIESSWRGLQYLLREVQPFDAVVVRVLDIGREELHKSLMRYRGSAWDQSPVFKKIYDDELCVLGGTPYAVLVADFEFSDAGPDVQLLSELSKVAEAGHAILVGGVSPALFRQDTFAEVALLRSVDSLLRSGAYRGWNQLRAQGERIVLAMPRMLCRLPYRGVRSLGLAPYEETVRRARDLPYTRSAFAIAAHMSASLERAELSGVAEILQCGGLVDAIVQLPEEVRAALDEVPRTLDARLPAASMTELRECGINVVVPRGTGERIAFASEIGLAASESVLRALLIGRIAHRIHQLRFQRRGSPVQAIAPRATVAAAASAFAWPAAHDSWIPVDAMEGVAITYVPAPASLSRRMQVGLRVCDSPGLSMGELLEIQVTEVDDDVLAIRPIVAGRWVVEDSGIGKTVEV